MLILQQYVRSEPRLYTFLDEQNFARNFSWSCELKQLFSFKFLNIIWWPLFKYWQRHFTRLPLLKYCKTLPGFTNLWTTIQKGSFAYNTLFLGINPCQRSSASTILADVTTLALFFGDELIDGVCKAAGKKKMREVQTGE